MQDLKDAIAELKSNKTLKVVLSVLRSIGNILNNTNVRYVFVFCFLYSFKEIVNIRHIVSIIKQLIFLWNFKVIETWKFLYLQAKGFDVSYLSKVPEVKDTMTKQSLLHHITECVLENRTDTTDLYSELGAVTRTSRVRYFFDTCASVF